MSFVTTMFLRDQGQHKQLQEKAKELGFLKPVGYGAKKDGSVSALLRAICEGELSLSPVAFVLCAKCGIRLDGHYNPNLCLDCNPAASQK